MEDVEVMDEWLADGTIGVCTSLLSRNRLSATDSTGTEEVAIRRGGVRDAARYGVRRRDVGWAKSTSERGAAGDHRSGPSVTEIRDGIDAHSVQRFLGIRAVRTGESCAQARYTPEKRCRTKNAEAI